MKTTIGTETSLRGVIDAMRDMVRVVGENGDVLLINDAFESRFGSVSGTNKCYECWGQDRECSECVRKHSLEAGDIVEDERRIDGRIYSLRATPMMFDNGKRACVEVFRDVSELAEARNKLAAVNKKMLYDLEMARQLQVSMLKETDSEIDGIRVTHGFFPCDAVGGDAIACYPIAGNRVLAYVSDVSGHGVSAAMLTVFIQQYIAQMAKNGDHSLEEYVRNIETAFLDMGIRKDVYITMFMVIIDTKSGMMEYMNIGHSVAPLLCDKSGCRELITRGAPVSCWARGMSREKKSPRLKKGDRLLLYTDGIISPLDTENSERRVRELFGEKWTGGHEFFEKIRGDEGRFIADDFAALIIERT